MYGHSGGLYGEHYITETFSLLNSWSWTRDCHSGDSRCCHWSIVYGHSGGLYGEHYITETYTKLIFLIFSSRLGPVLS